MKRAAILLWFLTAFVLPVGANDWPTYRADGTRSGYTPASLPTELSLHWTYRPTHAPLPAWPRSERMTFDRAYHSVIANELLFFGSSVDCQVHALDAKTGKPRWSFFTDGPIRFAPAVWKDRVFVVSDDGYLYCLAAEDGKLLWKQRGGPRDSWILGNSRMTSRWPARGGPVIVGDVVYFAAGVWPSDGLYLHAVNAETGELLWLNDSSGSIEMDQPHGGARANSGAASQGYLVAAGDRLLVPTGRAVPAAFGMSDGAFQYFQLARHRTSGGDTTVALGSLFYNSGMLFDSKTGLSKTVLGKGPLAAWPGGLVHASEKELVAYRWTEKETKDRRGQAVRFRVPEKTWSLDRVRGVASLIIAGETIICGTANQVMTVDQKTRKTGWSARVDGEAFALAVANERLYVGTDRGTIYCFGDKSDQLPVVINPQKEPAPFGESVELAEAAEAIIRETGVTQGYCLDLGCGDGALALEIAKRTELIIYAIDPDPKKVREARYKLNAAGLYGSRVTVHVGALDHTNYPDCFADLIVSRRSLDPESNELPIDELTRLQHPFGGIACTGRIGEMKKTVRGVLPGAGSWTHQYASAAGTCCSTDTRVKGPLEMFWFRDMDLELPDRHTRGPAPLVHQGKLVVLGLHALRAVDVYNGRILWEFPLHGILEPHNQEEHNLGVSGTGGIFCLSDDSVFVRWGSRCLRIDIKTGKLLHEFKTPNQLDGKPGTWGFLAYEDGTLFGSVANEVHQVQNPRWQWVELDGTQWSTESMLTESVSLFAVDVATGKQKWSHVARDSIRHNAIVIGGGRVYLIDRPLAIMDQGDRRRRGKPIDPHPPGQLVALDAESGKPLWLERQDVFGTMLALSVQHDALFMSYQAATDRLPSELGGRMAVLRASNGKRLWDKPAEYITRPLINDTTIYAQGGKFGFREFRGGNSGWEREPGNNGDAWDLLTGEPQSLNLGRSYGCGQIAGSCHLLVYRSATLGYFDLKRKAGTENYGGLRLGCWINAIPAGGLVLVPDATSGCSCSYLNQAWFALQSRE